MLVTATPSAALAAEFIRVREQTLALAAPLSPTESHAQAMPDASPTHWHLAHVTWFFETLVLERFESAFRPADPRFRELFNSYYNGVGPQYPRARRGLITHPDLQGVLAYRRQVDDRMLALLHGPSPPALGPWVTLGLHHEQQHQELLLTDALALLAPGAAWTGDAVLPYARRPAVPRHAPPRPLDPAGDAAGLRFTALDAPGDRGVVEIGHGRPRQPGLGDGSSGFAFDNETPRHRTLLHPYAIAQRLVTAGEWRDFIDDGGYRDSRWWMSAGWDWVRQQQITAPLYWEAPAGGGAGDWTIHGLCGAQALRGPAAARPVGHVSWFEADAYARWRSAQGGPAGLRLPTEAEWEYAAGQAGDAAWAGAHLLECSQWQPHPAAAASGSGVPPDGQQWLGDGWEWTASSYRPYPGFRAWDGEVGEYNAKFMIDQMVLRGGSFATPRSHLRLSYRNFFPTPTRWQFTAVRLAHDLD